MVNNTLAEIFYSEEDECYIVRLADNHYISAFGETVEEAFKEFGIA